MKEAVPWEKIEYSDNRMCIDLIERKQGGIISILDEEGTVPKGSDDGFVKKLIAKHKANPYLSM